MTYHRYKVANIFVIKFLLTVVDNFNSIRYVDVVHLEEYVDIENYYW